MKISIYSFGKTKHKFLLEGEREYLKRMGSEARINLVELGSCDSASATPQLIRTQERKALFAKVRENDFLVVLDENGQSYTTVKFAEMLKQCFDRGISSLTFAVAGPEGWDAAVTQRADQLLSLSPMTFTSQMARFILIEQLYRALRIIGGHPYHR
ncbi:MAG: 23S rRNA (pseudouridine(1915)-N(3))-methyltransferase RlmH [Deltaproteobacteria bacterium]|nr:23S rRNA (pseudouridine(1915)-N(3))-methyltransferase RlmH [Deltaproteobacteria bacterium]